jgi:transketolase
VAFVAEEKLNNILTIIDMNRLSEMKIRSDNSDKDLRNKFLSFGWDSVIVDGHSFKELFSAFDNFGKSPKPLSIIAKTIKGKGVSFMENNVEWHHKAPKPEQFKIALKEYE